MRDPGRPRRNPFFEHESFGDGDDAGMGFRDADEPAAGPQADATNPAGDVDGIGALYALVAGLSEAQPEAAEHLVAAAHEVVLTVKVLVDATEAVLADQRATMAARREAAAAASASPDADVESHAGARVSPLRPTATP